MAAAALEARFEHLVIHDENDGYNKTKLRQKAKVCTAAVCLKITIDKE
jgi:hypothetical protein